MHTIRELNVNRALATALRYLDVCGIEENSRNGKVLVAPEPVVTEYTAPLERVLFSPLRDANPYFHLMEALWMLAGREDLAWLQYFNSRYTYTDDGQSVPAAYGQRWRRYFGVDQLLTIAAELAADPTSRRCVLAMWDATRDLPAATLWQPRSKDVPCNTQVYFSIRGGKLDMFVCCRSNDALWGAYGANAVHFSMLHEIMASLIGVSCGVYRQLSYNLHIYTDVFMRETFEALAADCEAHDHYEHSAEMVYTPLVQGGDAIKWLRDCATFCNFVEYAQQTSSMYTIIEEARNVVPPLDPWFNNVALNMLFSYVARKLKFSPGINEVDHITAPDWRVACMQWLQRREARKIHAAG